MTMQPLFRAAIFDMDGTLADTEPLHRRAWQRFAQDHGRHLSDDEYHARLAGRAAALILTQHFGFAPDEAEQAYAEIQARFWEVAGDRIEPLPGLLPLLDRLAGMPLAVATGERGASARRRIRAIGVAERFDAFVTADDIRNGKPDPEIFLTAARRLGVEPGACLVFEDSLAGVAAARAAGMCCVALATSHPADALGEAQLVIHDFTDPRLDELLRLDVQV